MIVDIKSAGEIFAVEIRLSGAMQGDEKGGDLISIDHEKGSLNRLEIEDMYLEIGIRNKNNRNKRSQNWVKNYTLEFKRK